MSRRRSSVSSCAEVLNVILQVAVVSPPDYSYTQWLAVEEEVSAVAHWCRFSSQMERKHMSAFALYQTLQSDLPPPVKKPAPQVHWCKNAFVVVVEMMSDDKKMCFAVERHAPRTPARLSDFVFLYVSLGGSEEEKEEKGQWRDSRKRQHIKS